jgi:hypothetical protein
MNLDEINTMAEKAGAKFDHMTWVERDLAPVFYRFANLVEAKNRETVAKWMMERGYATGHGESVIDLLTELEWQVAEKEREACAVLCETECAQNDGITCAEEIRARGNDAA